MSVFDKIKNVLAWVGAAVVAIGAIVLGWLRYHRGGAGRVRDDIERAGDHNRRAAELAGSAADDADESIRHNRTATELAQRAAADNKRAVEIIRRIRDRGEPPKDTDSDF